ncbi:COX assembly mitochondrial protein [Balamuthia mandrillaris]
MHPPLKTGHEKCRQQIDALERCHKENPLAKFVGVCNSVRVALDKCLYEEYLELRQQNFERHREHREQADQMLRKKCTFASWLTQLSQQKQRLFNHL